MSDKKEPASYKNPGFWCKTTFIQIGYCMWVNFSALGIGLAFAFPGVMVPQLFDPQSEIHPSLIEESWIASVLSLSAPFGCLISGLLSDRFGRSRILFLSEGPMSLGWLYTGFAKTPVDIVIGRMITGIGCGMAMSGPRIYCTEISLPNIRGVTGAFPSLGIAVGITLQAGLGALLRWQMLCYICGAYSILLLLSNYFLPETPYFTLLKDTEENARKALKRFRSKKHDLEAEMADLLKFKREHKIHKLKFKQMVRTLFKPFACRPFGIVISYFAFTLFSGTYVIVMWAVVILEHSKSSVNPRFGNFILGITRIFSGIGVSLVMFRIRRRVMALTSAMGVSILCIAIGLYVHLTKEPTIFPQICFMLFIIVSTMGYATLPFLFLCELYPLQVRGVLVGISVSIYNIFMFTANFIFPYQKKYFGFANTMIMFGCISLVGFVVLYLFLLETKEFTLQQIEEYFKQANPILPFRMKPGAGAEMFKNVVIDSERQQKDLVVKDSKAQDNAASTSAAKEVKKSS